MSDPNKTVFISYRRDVSKYLAIAIFKDLQQNGYDVFLDIEKIDSGNWENAILNQIAARTHFVLLLTPGTLERSADKNDVLRQEIERAIALDRNIVLVLADNFDFKTVETILVGSLSKLPSYNGLPLYYEYFDEGMTKLRNRFLKPSNHQPSITPTPTKDLSFINQMTRITANQATPSREELSSEQLFWQAYRKDEEGDYFGAISDLTESIRLDPYDPDNYCNRGEAYFAVSQFDKALDDFQKFNELAPDDDLATADLALIKYVMGNISEAHLLWDILLNLDTRYRDVNWVRQELNWAEPLVEEARKLIAGL